MKIEVEVKTVPKRTLMLRENIGSFDDTPVGKVIIDQPIPPVCVVFQMADGERYEIPYSSILSGLIDELQRQEGGSSCKNCCRRGCVNGNTFGADCIDHGFQFWKGKD